MNFSYATRRKKGSGHTVAWRPSSSAAEPRFVRSIGPDDLRKFDRYEATEPPLLPLNFNSYGGVVTAEDCIRPRRRMNYEFAMDTHNKHLNSYNSEQPSKNKSIGLRSINVINNETANWPFVFFQF